MQKGFSLVELLLVIGVIGVLASIAIPQFSGFRADAMDADSVSNIKQIEIFQRQFKADELTYVSFGVADKVGGGVSVTVDGKVFSVQSLSMDVEMLCKTSADGQSLIISAKHKGSETIVAMDLDVGGSLRKLENQTVLNAIAIPNSTSGDDLSSWVKF